MAATPSSAPPPTAPPTPPAASTPLAAPVIPSAPPPSNATVSTPPPATPSTPPPAAPSVPSTPPPSTSLSPPPPNSTSPPPSNSTSSPPSNSTSPPPSSPSPSPPVGGTPTPRTPTPPSSGKGSRSSSSPPPPPPSGSSPPSSGGGDLSSTSTALVVGLVAGGAVLLVLFTLACVCCRKKKKRDGQYYGEPPLPPPRKDYGFAGQPQSWQQNVHPPEDHAIKLPPHLSPPPAHASRPPQPPPPPPPPMFSSSGASGSNYSSSETPLPPPSPGMVLGFSKSSFTFEELVRATDGFSDANLLGQGGFGYVHRGMLPNGKEVAVKQLKTGSGQGEREFQAEVEIISRVHHKHLVSLVGYCIAGVKRLLIYEFVPNNTLEFHLHEKGRPIMGWSTRLKIALGSAKGLAYLHEDCHPKIIHRDIKAANILLDFKFEAKVADFGLARFSADNNTHVSTRVMGTFGYLAPEYASSGKLTEKSDVFSFGVMLLELLTGRRPVDSTNTFMDDSLVDWARPILTRALEDDNYGALVDPRLQHNYNTQEMTQMVACAAACVCHSARRRPRMSRIVRALEGDVSPEDLNVGGRPGHSTVYGSLGSSDYDTSLYNEDMKKFRKLALTSEDYGSNEYGQNASGSSSETHTREIERAWMKKEG